MKRVLIAAVTLLATGCASIFNGTKQRIEVVSDPPGATASAAGERVMTPGVLRLPRKAKAAEIRIEKEGYRPKTVSLVRHVSGSVWWNLGWMVAGTSLGYAATQSSTLTSSRNVGDVIFAGGLAGGGGGAAIDFGSGAAYRLEPATVVVRLQREEPESLRPPP